MRFFTTLTLILLFCGTIAAQQDVIFEFANAQQTSSGGNDFYDVDILVSTTTDFKMGSGQLYFDYNPQAFGTSVFSNGRVNVTTAGAILGQGAGFPIYNSFTTNDNTTSRVSFSWGQALASVCFSNNVTASATLLLHLQIQYVAGGTAFDPGVCFTSAPPFDNQTFTACGPDSGACTFSDCGGSSGIQIILDAFDCTNAPLPLDLLAFNVIKDPQQNALARWQTANEVNTSHFEVERSLDTRKWTNIGMVQAAGFSPAEQQYSYLDRGLSELASSSNEVYYRLKMMDRDGAFTYSAIRSLSLDRFRSINVFPNPTGSSAVTLQVEGDEYNGQMELELVNTSGQAVWSQVIDQFSNASYQLDFGDRLHSGVYYLRGKDQLGKEFYERIVVMRR